MSRRSKYMAGALGVASLILGSAAIVAPVGTSLRAEPGGGAHGFLPAARVLVVSRVKYEGNTFGSTDTFPDIFSDPNVSGVQGAIFLDRFLALPGSPRLGTLSLTGITTSFSSKSEGALMRSANGAFLTYMGYDGPVGAEGVSNSYTTAANLAGNTAQLYDREVALIGPGNQVGLTLESNAYSGDNPRAVISVDGTQFYMAGNADSTIAGNGTGPGTTIGARYGTPGSAVSIQLGNYVAADRPDESAKKHVKDNNFRGAVIYNGNLYVSKGSGSNGDDGIFQVEKGTGNGLPTGTGNTIVQLLGGPATDPVTGNASPYTPFGFWFANPTTLYVADEGLANTDVNGSLIADPLAGLEKWSLVNGAWQLDYTLQDGLAMNQPETVPGYPVPTYTTGLRNMTGVDNGDGTVTLYAITAQYSAISGGEPDPTRLVAITDVVSATSLPAGERDHRDGREGWGPAFGFRRLDRFQTLQASRPGEVFRGVALAPCEPYHGAGSCDGDGDRDDR
jgi:hypothetical protein